MWATLGAVLRYRRSFGTGAWCSHALSAAHTAHPAHESIPLRMPSGASIPLHRRNMRQRRAASTLACIQRCMGGWAGWATFGAWPRRAPVPQVWPRDGRDPASREVYAASGPAGVAVERQLATVFATRPRRDAALAHARRLGELVDRAPRCDLRRPAEGKHSIPPHPRFRTCVGCVRLGSSGKEMALEDGKSASEGEVTSGDEVAFQESQ